jgi:hypothetical protein
MYVSPLQAKTNVAALCRSMGRVSAPQFWVVIGKVRI